MIGENLAGFEMGVIIYFGDFFEICEILSESNQLSNIRCKSILGIECEDFNNGFELVFEDFIRKIEKAFKLILRLVGRNENLDKA